MAWWMPSRNTWDAAVVYTTARETASYRKAPTTLSAFPGAHNSDAEAMEHDLRLAGGN